MSTAIAAAVDEVLSDCTEGLLSQTLADSVKLQNCKVLNSFAVVDERNTRARGWCVVQGCLGGSPGRDLRRGGFQHQHDWLSGGPHRPFLRRPDCDDDRPADWQLRHRGGGSGIGRAEGG